MAALEKIRTKFGLAISIIIALALLSFIIDPSTLETALNSMSSKYDVGAIAGKSVSYTDFQADIDKYTTINQLMTGSSVQNEEAQKGIRDAAWQSLIDKYLFVKNAKSAGINVGDDEVAAFLRGEIASPLVSQNPAFADENGNFSLARLQEFVQSVESDESGQLSTFWEYLKTSIYNQQFYAKYGSLFSASNIENKLMLEGDIADNNTTANIDYVLSYYPFAKDTTVTVSSDEIKAFYNNHKDFFKQGASRDVEYVVFEVVPSAKDIQETADAMAAVYDEFAATDTPKAFLLKNSDRQLSDYWYKAGDLQSINAQLDEAIFGGADVTPIIQDGNTFFAAKTIANAQIPDSAYVKHILLQGENAKSVADSLLGVIGKGSNFSSIAAVYSADQGSAADGELGNIGWMTQTYMIPGFESVLTADINKPFILNTQYGTHVVLVSQKTKPIAKKQVAILEKGTLASKETYNEFYSQANTFSTIANGTYEGYKKALDSTKVYSHPMNNITEATSSYGAIDQAKEVTRWAFDNKAGKASGIITVNNNYFFVVALKGIHKEGYTPIKEAAAQIESRLYADKIQDKAKAEAAAKVEGMTSLEQIAEALGTSVQSKTGVTLSTMGSQAVEPALIGAIAKADEGKICGPVAGQVGVYYFKVAGRETGSFYTEDDAKTLAAQKAQYASQLILPTMMDEAKVKDNRARFF